MTHLSITLLRVIPTLTNDFAIVSDSSSGSIYGLYFLTSYSGIPSEILYWHSILAFYLASFLASMLTSYLAYYLRLESILTFFWHLFRSLAFFLIFYLASILTIFLACNLAFYLWHSIWHSVLAFYLMFYSGILSGNIWHLVWHSIRAFYLAPLLTFSLHGHWDLALAVEGSAVPTEIWSSQLQSWAGRRKEKGRRKAGERRKENATLMKSRDPHLAGGEKDSQDLANTRFKLVHISSHQFTLGQHKKYKARWTLEGWSSFCPGSDTDHSWGIYQTDGERELLKQDTERQKGRMEQKCQTKKQKETNEDKGI